MRNAPRVVALVAAPLLVVGATAMVMLPRHEAGPAPVSPDGPRVTILAPPQGAVLELQPVQVQAKAEDPDGIATAELRVNDKQVANQLTSGGFHGRPPVHVDAAGPGRLHAAGPGPRQRGQVGRGGDHRERRHRPATPAPATDHAAPHDARPGGVNHAVLPRPGDVEHAPTTGPTSVAADDHVAQPRRRLPPSRRRRPPRRRPTRRARPTTPRRSRRPTRRPDDRHDVDDDHDDHDDRHHHGRDTGHPGPLPAGVGRARCCRRPGRRWCRSSRPSCGPTPGPARPRARCCVLSLPGGHQSVALSGAARSYVPAVAPARVHPGPLERHRGRCQRRGSRHQG